MGERGGSFNIYVSECNSMAGNIHAADRNTEHRNIMLSISICSGFLTHSEISYKVIIKFTGSLLPLQCQNSLLKHFLVSELSVTHFSHVYGIPTTRTKYKQNKPFLSRLCIGEGKYVIRRGVRYDLDQFHIQFGHRRIHLAINVAAVWTGNVLALGLKFDNQCYYRCPRTGCETHLWQNILWIPHYSWYCTLFIDDMPVVDLISNNRKLYLRTGSIFHF